jgi:hypothetical protein
MRKGINRLEMLINEFVDALAQGDHNGWEYNDANNPFCQYSFHRYSPLQTVSSLCITDGGGKKLQMKRFAHEVMPRFTKPGLLASSGTHEM